jgi:hypothetical protein
MSENSPIIDAESREDTYVVTIETVVPGNLKSAKYPITVKAGDQIEAMAKAYAVWDDGTNRAAFLGTDIKKVK